MTKNEKYVANCIIWLRLSLIACVVFSICTCTPASKDEVRLIYKIDTSQLLSENTGNKDAISRVLTVLENRYIDFWEIRPVISRLDNACIEIRLKNNDPAYIQRVRDVVENDPVLEFRLEASKETVNVIMDKINEHMKKFNKRKKPDRSSLDMLVISKHEDGSTDTTTLDDYGSYIAKPFFFWLAIFQEEFVTPVRNIPRIDSIVQSAEVRENILKDVEFFVSSKPVISTPVQYHHLYLVQKTPNIPGEMIKEAWIKRQNGHALNSCVMVEFTLQGIELFSEILKTKIENRLVIILDGKIVYAIDNSLLINLNGINKPIDDSLVTTHNNPVQISDWLDESTAISLARAIQAGTCPMYLTLLDE